MGITDKILSFGSSKRGKIISWSLVVGCSLIFFIGILIVAIPNKSTPKLNELSFIASNMAYKQFALSFDEEGNREELHNAYHLTVSKLETLVGITAIPTASRATVTFETSSPYISFENKNVRAGSTLKIKLEKNQGEYGFKQFKATDPEFNADAIKITAKSGRLSSVIYVRIILDPNDYQLTAVLQERNIDDHGIPISEWRTGTTVSISQLTGNSTTERLEYRIRLRFSLMGELLYDTATDETDYDAIIYRELYQEFDPNDQPFPNMGWDDSIFLWTSLLRYIQENPDMNLENSKLTYSFRINGTDYFTKTNFIITLVA